MHSATHGMQPSNRTGPHHRGSAAGAGRKRSARAGRKRAKRRIWLGVLVLVLAAAAGGFWYLKHQPLFVDDFSQPNGLITNEFATFNPSNPAAVTSPQWIVTSGSLYARDNAAWTGVPDTGLTGPRSEQANNSDIFRLVTRPKNFQNVMVSFSLRVERFMPPPPGLTWQGVHIFMRYQNPDLLYVISVDRRDGDILIKKKVPAAGPDGGRYYTIATAKRPTVTGRWEQVKVSAVNTSEGGVELKVWLGDQLILQGTDNGYGDIAPITGPGRVGLRGDYTEFSFDNFQITRA